MDIDGSLLALSLEDFRTATYGNDEINGYLSKTRQFDATGDRDDMDVDSMSDLKSNETLETLKEDEKLSPISRMEHKDTSTPLKDQIQNSAVEEQEDNSSIEIEPENSSFVSALSHTLFSPTNIGAKYAMKLLPPPESNDSKQLRRRSSKKDDTIDYEYDTSLVKSEFPTRHINSFSSNSDNSLFLNGKEDEPEFVYNPAKKDYDEEIYNNSMSRSYLFRRHDKKSPSPSPLNIPTSSYNDLRDYTNLSREDVSEYTNPNFSGNIHMNNSYGNNTPKNPNLEGSGLVNASGNSYTPMGNISQMSNLSQNTPTSVQVHHHHYYYSPNKDHSIGTPAINDSLSQYNNTYYLSPVNQLHSRFIEDVRLPPPWKQESSPKEKYSYIISTYLQLIINTTLSVYGLYLVYNVIKTVRADINFKLVQQSKDILVEISTCQKNYEDNNCSPDLIVPALEKPCEYWSKCMNQDPKEFGNKSSISAETLGIIVNSLIEPLGFKFFLMFFTSILLIFMFNFTFGFIRAKSYYGQFTYNDPNAQAKPVVPT